MHLMSKTFIYLIDKKLVFKKLENIRERIMKFFPQLHCLATQFSSLKAFNFLVSKILLQNNFSHSFPFSPYQHRQTNTHTHTHFELRHVYHEHFKSNFFSKWEHQTLNPILLFSYLKQSSPPSHLHPCIQVFSSEEKTK